MSLDLDENPNQIYDDENVVDDLQSKTYGDETYKDISSESGYSKDNFSKEGIIDKGIDELKNLEEMTGLGDSAREKNLGGEGRESKSISEALREAEDRRRNGESFNDADSYYKENENTGKKGPRGLFAAVDNKRKRFVASTMVLSVAATVFGTVATSAGPAKLLFLGDTLEKGHFFTQEDMGAIRMYKLIRNVRYAVKSPEKLRLNSLQNTYAKKLDANIKKAGFDIELSDRLYQNKALVFDVNAVDSNNKLAELKNKSPQEVLDHFKQNFGMEGRIDSGKVVFDTEGLNTRQTRKLFKGMVRASGYELVAPTGRAKTLAKRGGAYSVWHPVRKADEAILKKVDKKLRFDKWQTSLQERLKKGTKKLKGKFKAEERTVEAEDGSTSTEVDPDSAALAEEAEKINAPDPDAPGAVAETRAKLGKVGTAAALAGLVCIVQSVSNNIDDVRQNNVILPLMRLGIEMISVRSQIQAGEDYSLDQLKYYSKQLANESADATKNWANDKSLQFERGFAKLTGRDIPDEIQVRTERNPVSKFLNSVTGLAGACDVVNSTAGFVILTSIDIFTGPLSAAASILAGQLLVPGVIDGITSWMTGDQVNMKLLRASAFAGASNYGARYAANESMAAAGGVPLTDAQSLALRNIKLDAQQEEFSSKSLASRLFDQTDSSSLYGRVAMASPDSTVGIISSFASSFSRPFSSVGSALSGITSSPIFADETKEQYDYGFPEIGYTYDQINDPSLDNPYKNAKDVYKIMQSKKGAEYRQRVKDCFKMDMDRLGNITGNNSTVTYGKIMDPELKCGGVTEAGELQASSNDKDWLKVRMSIYDTQLLEAAACFDGAEEKACTNTGMAYIDQTKDKQLLAQGPIGSSIAWPWDLLSTTNGYRLSQ